MSGRLGRILRSAVAAAAAVLASSSVLPSSASAASGPFSLWTSTQGPASNEYYLDPSPLEIGVRFFADGAGQVAGVRFYKVSGNNGVHVGHLWTNGGVLLGTATFSGETASGWQTALFPAPISIQAGTTYVASFHSTSGYAVTRSYFAAARDNPPLHAPASAAGALNGLYAYSANTVFPTQSTQQSNYWVDVSFNLAGSTSPAPNPTPSLASIAPSSAVAGGSAFTLTARGSGFVSGSVVRWNGAERATTFVSGSTLTAAIPASDLASSGSASVSVFSPAPGGGTSNAVPFTIGSPAGNPVPSIASLSPSSATAGDPGFTLTVAGSGFASGAVVRWNGSDRATTFVSASTVRASIPASDVSSSGSATVAVFNPAPGGGLSNGLTFNVGSAAPPPPPPSTTTFTLWTAQGPASNEFYLDPNPLTLGVRFFSDVPGQITGIRFYKVSGNSGPHSAQLYTSTGGLLGTASFASETASGWQTANFAAPISIASNTAYVAAYFSPTGYAATRNYFTTAFDNPPLHAPANASNALNGLYVYGSSPAFPRNSYLATNYWVDVAFTQAASTSTAPPPARTIVSLTFDDGTAGHVVARRILDARGLKGTFYINSGRIGASGYMSLDDIRGIEAAGHEIGGHTIHHFDLTTLSSADVQHEICDDRAALQDLGLRPTAFAYPFGAYNASVESVVRSCGYTDGRALGGVSCAGCPLSETTPPRDTDAIITPDSIKSSTTLVQMEKYVTDAEQAGGGWVVLVMHVICEGCDTYSISSGTLAAFSDWVRARSSLGTVVRTVGDVMGSPAIPPGPFLSALTPSQAAAGGPSFTLTASGGGFAPGSVVRWNGSARSTTFVSASTLTATISAADVASPGISTVTVLNPDASVSSGRLFQTTASTAPACLTSAGTWQNQPFPSQPSVFEARFDATPGSGAIDGVAGFSSGPASGFPMVASIVRFSTSGFIDARDGAVYRADAAIPYAAGTVYSFRLEVNVGSHDYSVFVSTRGGTERSVATLYGFRTEQGRVPALDNLAVFADAGSESVCALSISTIDAGNPVPAIASLSPSSATAGGPGFTLAVNGSGFNGGSAVRWNGSDRPTTLVSSTALTAAIPSGDLSSTGTVTVTVFNPGPGGGLSNDASFVVSPAASPDWAFTGSMTTGRLNNTETLLADGRVLVAGGWGPWVPPFGPSRTRSFQVSAEIYNPATQAFTQTSSMTVARAGHMAARLRDGRVLVAGGGSASAEVYDPSLGTWSPAGSMSSARDGGAAVLLPNGKVLVAGGGTSSAELFDPAAGTWSPTGSMFASRTGLTLTLLNEGRVLAAGGGPDGGAEAYDPSAGTWSAAGTMSLNRSGHSATLLQDGRVLVVGGPAGAGTEIYNPATGSWSAVSTPLSIADNTATLLSDGKVLIVLGGDSTASELYDPARDAWSATSPFLIPHTRHTAAALASGKVLVVGGENSGGAIQSAELYLGNPSPVTAALSPSSAPAGGSAFTLSVFGRGFVSSSTVRWNGSPRPTSFVSVSTLTASIPAGDIASAGTASVTVFNPGPQGGISNAATFTVAAPASAFFDDFSQPDGLITNQNSASPRSTKWLVTNGSLFASGGQGWTGVPDNVVPNATSSNGTGSAIFRALTAPTGVGSDVSVKVTVAGFVSAQPVGNWDGAHVYLRYQDLGNYYQLSVYRRDGRAAIKKRLNGTESTFNTPLYAAAPVGTQQTARAVAINNSNGSVTLQLYVGGTLVASAVDTASPITATGKVGMAGENTNFRFDDFTVAAPTAPSGGAVATASFAPASQLVTASFGASVQQIDATGVTIPENALSTDTVVTVARAGTIPDADLQERKRRAEQLQSASDEIEFAPLDARFKTPVDVVLGYDPAKLAAAKIKEKDLKIYWWDDLSGRWLGLPSTLDRNAHTVRARTQHFSLYQLMAPDAAVLAADAAFGWKAHYVFPNPVRGSRTATFRVQPGVVDGLELRVYDVAARRVYSSSDFRNLGAFDDGNGLGPQFTYENVWDVSGVGSGVYTYIVIAKKGGRDEIREYGKVGVVK